MSRRGNPYDNAKAESFMKTLKVEAVYLVVYETFEDVTADLPRCIGSGSVPRRPRLLLPARSSLFSMVSGPTALALSRERRKPPNHIDRDPASGLCCTGDVPAGTAVTVTIGDSAKGTLRSTR